MIKITDSLSVMSDGRQYVVGTPYTRVNKKSGKEETRLLSPHYYTTMGGVVRDLVRRTMYEKVENCEITSLRGYLKELRQQEQRIKDLTEWGEDVYEDGARG